MKPIVRNILAIIVGFLVGGFLNMGIIIVGSMLIPAPDGIDPMNAESLKNNMHLFQPYHFITPFLAHAGNAFIGALITSLIAASNRLILAMIIGVLTLLGGIYAATVIPAPTWYIIVDLVFAYLPMAWLGWKISGKE